MEFLPSSRLHTAAIAAIITFGNLSAAEASDHFSGKTVRIIVGAGPASGYALYGQLIAHHLAKFVPGNPTTVVSFMPGASGLTAMNYLFEAAPKDGATIGVAMQDLPVQQAISTKGVRYDARSFGYIGRASSNAPIHYVWRTSKVHNFADAKVREITSGASSATGSQSYLPRASNALLGTKWKVIAGYGDVRERHLAVERGEVEAGIAGAAIFRDQLSDALSKELIFPIVQYSRFRHPLFRDVSTIVELAGDEDIRQVFAFLVADLGRSFITPPRVPQEIVDTLRKAFASMIANPTFVAEAEKRGADLDFMSGSDLASYVDEILRTRPEIIAKARHLMATN